MFIHHFLKIHYLSGAVLIQTTGVADSLYYSYSDAQGSLIALVHDGGSVIQRFAYDPWGARKDPNNWNVKDSRTSFIINRGYTGHEHLDAFGIINMNGRVYDPATGMFFSPDSYVQAPGNWLNYNRYSYCSGNPLKYTDPSGDLQIGPFYLSLNIGWSAQGGLSLGISGGVGIEKDASVGLSIGFGAKYGNFSISINGGLGGAYAYAGYDTKGGWMAGAGYSFTSLYSMFSPVSLNSNMFGVGVDYSENGGFSGNYSALNISSSGMSINPSFGLSYKYEIPTLLDLSKGYAASAVKIKDLKQKVWGRLIRKFHGINIYESKQLGTFEQSEEGRAGGMTLPGKGIVVGQGVLSRSYDLQMLEHEFGHILQARLWGNFAYYSVIAKQSLSSGIMQTILGHDNYQHESFWTETYADFLSSEYFGNNSTWDTNRFPIQNLDLYHYELLKANTLISKIPNWP